MIHALLVDDDDELRRLLADYLRGFQMHVTAVADAAGLRRALAGVGERGAPSFDVLLLDLMLPDGDGLDICRTLRGSHALPIIMLTARGDPASRVVGLELGADDYLAKPFTPRELVARINAVLRRTGHAGASPAERTAQAAVLHFAGWRFERLQHRLVSPQQVVVVLSNAEYRLLSAFVAQPRRVLGRGRLLELHGPVRAGAVGGAEAAADAPAALRAIDLAVSRLRQKLGDAARDPQLIRTVRGEGYLFNAEVT